MDSVLNSATTTKISTKHRSVCANASDENMKRYCCMGMLNSPAVKNDNPRESPTPSARPTANEIAPTQTVSMSTMAETCPGRMPRSR